MSQTEIAAQILVNKSTISRELKRNIPLDGQAVERYIVERAQRKTDYRHSNKAKKFF